ncbi:MAG: FAD-dependent monooxygenase [Marivibrio sp.]|uniref:NAD(P)/FAD-dependent oxidoreductase n=1 Tax=Marivibrio sp. TaxID=2039719 RepID=UPI0032EC7625
MTRTFDVAVVGAGPAGAVAATLLSRAGRRVALIDPADAARPGIDPEGPPKIGETLPAAADRLLRAHGLPAAGDDPAHRPIAGSITLWGGPPQRTDAFADPEGPSLRLDRRRFDAALRGAALDAGARPLRARLRRVARDANGWRLTAEGGALSAGWLIDATGRAAALARSLGATVERESPQIALWAVGAPSPVGAPPAVDRTLIERESGEAGWWYAARLPDGRPLAALHTPPRVAVRLRADPTRWRARLAATRLIADHLAAEAFADAPLQAADARGGRLLRPVGDGWLACGDAALHVDPIASQGLFNALAGGVSAARVLTADDHGGAADAYVARLADVWARYRLRRETLSVRLAAGERRGSASAGPCSDRPYPRPFPL